MLLAFPKASECPVCRGRLTRRQMRGCGRFDCLAPEYFDEVGVRRLLLYLALGVTALTGTLLLTLVI
jgi:hypothetical protein